MHRPLVLVSVLALRLLFSHATVAAAPVVLQQFEGLSNADNWDVIGSHVYPPDNGLAVGPGHVVQMVNKVGRATDKTGTVVSQAALRDVFGLDPGFDGSDPRIIYDAPSGRWYATYMNYSDLLWQSSIVLAVSATSDPTGPFCRYRLGNPLFETFKQDYPMLGISDDKVVVSYHGFDFATSVFLFGGYYVVNKAQVMACVSTSPVRVLTGASGWKPAPALSSTSTAYLAAHGVSASFVAIRSINGTPGGAPITVSDTFLPIGDWSEPPDAVQKGSSVLLDVDRRTQTVVWRDESLWLGGNGACVPPGDVVSRSCIRLVEVRTDTMTVRQDIVLRSAGRYYFNPAVQIDAHGNVFVVFMASSASDFLGVRATGRLSTDPLNTLQPSILLRAGEAALTGGALSGNGAFRVGDYSGAAVDPMDPLTVWVSSEYAKSTGDWGTYVAALTFPTAVLSVLKTGAGSGTISSSPAGINCGVTCSTSYASGTTVTLTATPAANSIFTGWSGAGCTGTGACTVALTAATSVTATFTLATFSLTVAKTGTGRGAVTSSPGGISCGVTCAASYTSGTAVTLTAAPAAGSTFAGWSGGGCSGTGPCTVTLTAATTVTATFTLVMFQLTVTKAGTGGGSVSSSPAGISCGAACSANYASGTTVTMTATPAANSSFAGWSGAGCSGTGACTVTLTAAATVTATFDLVFFALTVTIAGSADGTVVSNPTGIACGSTCAATYAAGTVVTLTATASAGAAFARWGGACSGTTASCAVTLDTARSVTARFSKEFTDPTILAASTVIKAVHIADLRSAIAALRAHLGLSPFSWTDPTLVPGATAVRAIHLMELRTALAQAYAAAGTASPTYTDPTLETGHTVVKRAHLIELRDAVGALE